MILPQKTMVTLANFLPQYSVCSQTGKRYGKEKSEKFGEELLDLIISYCRKEKIEPQK